MEELLLIFVVVLVMCVIAFNDSSSLCVLLPVGGLFAYTMNVYSQKKNSSACNLYHKKEYYSIEEMNIYHFWQKQLNN